MSVISLGSVCVGESSHRYGLMLKVNGDQLGEPGRLPVGKGLGRPCAAACRLAQLEDREMISARTLELRYC